MSDQRRDRDHDERNRLQRDMRRQEQQEGGARQQGGSLDHHGLAGRMGEGGLERDPNRFGQRQQGVFGDQDQSGLGQGSQKSDGAREMGWNQNADDIGRQYDPSGFAQGGQDRPQQQGWSGETRADRQQFQSEYDEQIQDDGSMTREQKLQQGWQDPDDPGQIADEGLIDEDEEDAQGGRI